VSPEEGTRLSRRLGFIGFNECSAATMWNMHETFDALARSATRYHSHSSLFDSFCDGKFD
jgi:hypothetical protein